VRASGRAFEAPDWETITDDFGRRRNFHGAVMVAGGFGTGIVRAS